MGDEIVDVLGTNGQLERQTVDPNGLDQVTNFAWSQQLQLTGTEEPSGATDSASYVASGAAYQSTDFRGNTTATANNPTAQPTQVTGPTGGVSHTAYNAIWPTDAQNASGQDTMTHYNGQGLPTAVSTPTPIGDNLVPNPSFELMTSGFPTNWTAGGTGSVAVVTSPVKYGQHALQLAASGSAQAYANTPYIPVTPGARYFLSYWTDTQNVSAANADGIRLDVHWYTNTTGTSAGNTYAIGVANGTSGGWVQESGTVTAPTTATEAVVSVTLANPGTATVDGVSMIAQNPDELANSSFTQDAQLSGIPDNWAAAVGSGLTFEGGIDTSASANWLGLPS
ncbi:MAG TPA: hypothetical protein VE197_23565, partial [Mycobacterium sp.]|nr:hypothetical protein [Mycobacterium sp.]